MNLILYFGHKNEEILAYLKYQSDHRAPENDEAGIIREARRKLVDDINEYYLEQGFGTPVYT